MTVATSWVDSVGGLAAVVNIAAIVVGGSGAYFKFARGRTFAYRMETGLSAALLAGDDARALDVTVELRNTGASKIPLSDVVKVIYVYGVRPEEIERIKRDLEEQKRRDEEARREKEGSDERARE